jgi:hypothetical protein
MSDVASFFLDRYLSEYQNSIGIPHLGLFKTRNAGKIWHSEDCGQTNDFLRIASYCINSEDFFFGGGGVYIKYC